MGGITWPHAGAAQAGVWLSSMDLPQARRILPDVCNTEIVEPPHDARVGAVLFTRAGTLMALPFDMERLEAAGDPFPVVQALVAATSPHWLLATSGQGVLAYVSGQRRSPVRLAGLARQKAQCCRGYGQCGHDFPGWKAARG
jgi:hypothetical protein